MIKSNELRIGNVIADSRGHIWQIDHWECENKVASKEPYLGIAQFSGKPMHGHPATEYVESLQPIPLTEKTISKTEFNCIQDGWYEFGLFTWDIYDKDLRYNGVYLGEPDYLHTLQNIIFAIRGEELNVSRLI